MKALADLLWRLLAWLVTREPVKQWLVLRAFRTPYTHIHAQGNPNDVYMARWWLFNPYSGSLEGGSYVPTLKWCPISIRVHHILRPDEDRDLHDHPWNARTVILAGWYDEEREGGVNARRCVGDTASLAFGEYHRINDVSDGGVVTLFITGRKRGTWGFKVDGQKVPYRTYLGLPEPAGDATGEQA